MGLIYPSFESRTEIAALVAARDTVPGRAIRTARRSIPARRGQCRLPSAQNALPAVNPTRCASTWRRRWRAAARSVGLRRGAGPSGETGAIAASPANWGDVILARKDTPTSYHLAVVVDDAAQGVTDVVRGQDLFYATSVHRLLQTLLGLPAPRYRHHRLLLDADGRKLAKSTQSTGLRELRAQGLRAADIRRLVGLG